MMQPMNRWTLGIVSAIAFATIGCADSKPRAAGSPVVQRAGPDARVVACLSLWNAPTHYGGQGAVQGMIPGDLPRVFVVPGDAAGYGCEVTLYGGGQRYDVRAYQGETFPWHAFGELRDVTEFDAPPHSTEVPANGDGTLAMP
jgi:hypothetical protein